MDIDSETDESIDMSDIRVDERSFTLAVDSAIRSGTPSILGSSCVHSFASVVDRAIRSRTPSILEGSRVPSFASVVDGAIRSDTSSNFGASPLLGFVARHAAAPLIFTRAELVAATNNFSLDSKISDRSFGVVYRGKLVDGREVAIKRAEAGSNRWSPIFKSELAFLSRLHHKHLVGLVGFCEEIDEWLLVYEYVQNGSLYDHLHHKGSNTLNSWKMRINIALDASLGLEYLHRNYRGQFIIFGNVKSSNILLDAAWTARVSDFGLTFMKNTAGTVGYMDPQFSPVLTEKSDVYGLGVVLLELLTGKTAIYKSGEDGGKPLSVVNFSLPAILSRRLVEILDPKVGPPDVYEAEALELVANTALNCVNLKREDRPIMANIVFNLKLAFAISKGIEIGHNSWVNPTHHKFRLGWVKKFLHFARN